MTTDHAGGDREWIGEDFRHDVSTQSYSGRKRIDGVQVIDLVIFSDEGGDFCEISRLNEDGTLTMVPGYRPAQISYSLMEPGQIKAFHLHRNQDDVWFVPPAHRLLVGLLDIRETSESYRDSMRIVMGAGKSRLLVIPRGIAHGVANLSTAPASLVYFTNTQFDSANPDEHRLPHTLLGDDFWTIRPG